jgi:hypothetical protein
MPRTKNPFSKKQTYVLAALAFALGGIIIYCNINNIGNSSLELIVTSTILLVLIIYTATALSSLYLGFIGLISVIGSVLTFNHSNPIAAIIMVFIAIASCRGLLIKSKIP